MKASTNDPLRRPKHARGGATLRVVAMATMACVLTVALSSCAPDGAESDVAESAGIAESDVNQRAAINGIRRYTVPGDSVARWVDSAEAIARVKVVDTGPFLYNSPSGLMPTPDSSGHWPISISHQLDLERTVTLEILELISGDYPDLEGIVSIEYGTPLPGVPSEELSPVGYENPNTEGIAFLILSVRNHLREYSPQDMRVRVADARALLLSLGDGYEYGASLNFYRFEGHNATSDLDGRTMPIAQLEAEIQSRLADPGGVAERARATASAGPPRSTPTVTPTGRDGYPDPDFVPIYTAADAISRTLNPPPHVR